MICQRYWPAIRAIGASMGPITSTVPLYAPPAISRLRQTIAQALCLVGRLLRILTGDAQGDHAGQRRISQGFTKTDFTIEKGQEILILGGQNAEMIGIESLQNHFSRLISATGAPSDLGQ